MKITKLGHCCLMIEEQGIKILTDPGEWTTAQNEQIGIHAVLITHEHADHLHVESLKTILKNNPQAQVITNEAVGLILQKENIVFELVEGGSNTKVQNLKIEGFGDKHALIYTGLPQVQNTGYMVAEKLFYPGDSLHNPGRPVQVLALPVAGPWLKISEAIDYAKAVNPEYCFPVHDGMLKIYGFLYKMLGVVLNDNKFVPLEDGRVLEIE